MVGSRSSSGPVGSGPPVRTVGTAPGPEAPTRIAPPARLPPSPWDFPDLSEPLTGRGDVLGAGADLEAATLVHAYRNGIFPWPHPDVALPWFSPDPRGVVAVDRVHVARSLRQRLRRSGWTTTMDAALPAVIARCAERGADEGTWIDGPMAAAYARLGRLGWAHSIEVWDHERLVGGLYGVLVGGVFTGESMFHREPDASKAALVDLAARLEEAGGRLIDVQVVTGHLATLGARELEREAFRRTLAEERERPVRPIVDRLPVARLA